MVLIINLTQSGSAVKMVFGEGLSGSGGNCLS